MSRRPRRSAGTTGDGPRVPSRPSRRAVTCALARFRRTPRRSMPRSERHRTSRWLSCVGAWRSATLRPRPRRFGGSSSATGLLGRKDRPRRRARSPGRPEAAPGPVRRAARPGPRPAGVHRRDLDGDEHGPQPGPLSARGAAAHSGSRQGRLGGMERTLSLSRQTGTSDPQETVAGAGRMPALRGKADNFPSCRYQPTDQSAPNRFDTEFCPMISKAVVRPLRSTAPKPVNIMRTDRPSDRKCRRSTV